MSWIYAGRYFNDLRAQNVTTKLLQTPTSCTVHVAGTSTLADLWSDKTKETAANNPLSTGVAEGVAGISTIGNLLIFADPGDYDLTINGVTETITINVDPAEIASIRTDLAASLAVLAAGTTVGSQPALNIIGLKSGRVTNNTAAGRIDADFTGAVPLWVQAGDLRDVTNAATIAGGQQLANLTFTCEAGHTYFFDGAIYVDSTAAAGVKLSIDPPSGASFRIPLQGAGFGQTADATQLRWVTLRDTLTGPQQFGGFSAGIPTTTINIGRSYLYTPTAGDLTVSFCQAAATADTTEVLDGSGYFIVDVT